VVIWLQVETPPFEELAGSMHKAADSSCTIGHSHACILCNRTFLVTPAQFKVRAQHVMGKGDELKQKQMTGGDH
jgi:hypothetical protein